MSEERVDIVVEDKVSDEPARKIKLIATNARDAHDAVTKLVAAVGSINSGAVAKLQKEMTAAAVQTTQQASAYERLQAAQARTATAVARLERAQNQANAAGAQAAVVQQRLTTEMERTEAASLRAATAREKLAQVQQRGAASVEQDGAAMVKMYQTVERERAKAAAAATQAGINASFGIGQGSTGAARASMGVFQQDAIDKAAAAKATDELARKTIALKSAIDPAFAAQRTMNAALADAKTLLAAGSITAAEFAAANALARKEFEHAAVGKAAVEMDHFNFATAGAKRELIVLGHELAQGNWSRLGGSLSVLVERTNAWNLLLSSTFLLVAATVLAVGTLAVAYAKGAAELHNFTTQTTLTNNAIGLSASNFTSMRGELTKLGATKGKAAEVLTDIAASGINAAGAVKEVSTASILLERAVGTSIGATVKQFEELAKSPAEASAKLNEKYHYLTGAVYDQIKALEDQSRTVDAANLAEETYAKAMSQRATRIIDSQGSLETGWNKLKDVAKGAWDAMLNVGREQSTEDKLKAVRKQIEDAAKSGNQFAVLNAEPLKAVAQDLQRRLELENSNVASQQLSNRQAEISIQWAKQHDSVLTDEEKKQRELAKARAEAIELFGAQYQEAAKYIEHVHDIEQKYMQTGGADVFAGLKAQLADAKEAVALLNQEMAGGIPGSVLKLTAAEKQANDIQAKLNGSLKDGTRAHLEQALAVTSEVIAAERLQQLTQKQRDLWAKDIETIHKQAQANDTLAESWTRQADEQNSIADNFGKSEAAIKRATLAEVNKQIVDAEAATTTDQYYTASLYNERDALLKLIPALDKVTAKQVDYELAKLSGKNVADQRQLQAEIAALGESASMRALTLTQRRVEVEYAEKLVEAQQKGATAEQLNTLATQKALASSNAFASEVLKQWQQTADSINGSLTDAIDNWVMKGESLVKGFINVIKSEFDKLVLRPTISALLTPIGNAAASFVQGGANALGNALGVGNLYGKAAGFSAPGGAFDSLLGTVGMGSGIGGAAASAAEIAATEETTSAMLTAAGGAADAAEASAALAASMTETAAATTGLTGALAAVPVYGWIAAAALAIFASSSSGGGPKSEGGFSGGFNIAGTDIGGNQQGSQRGDVASAQKLAEGISASLAKASQDFGVLLNTAAGVFYAKDPQGNSQTQLQVVTANYNRSNATGGIENVGRSDAEFETAFALAASTSVLKALQSSGLQGKIADFINAIDSTGLTSGQIDALLTAAANAQKMYIAFDRLGPAFASYADLTVDGMTKLIGTLGGFDAATANLSSYYDNFYTDAEKRMNTATQISAALAKANLDMSADAVLALANSADARAQFRGLVEQFVAAGPEGQATVAALLSVNAAFASLIPAAQEAAAAIDAVLQATNDQIMADVNAASSDLIAARKAATDADTAAIKSSISVLDAASKKWRALSQSLLDFKNGLLFGDASPLTPKQQYEQASTLLNTTFDAAKAGDENAINRLQTVMSDFLKASQVYNASGGNYVNDFNRVQSMLAEAIDKSSTAADHAEAQLAIAQAQETSLEAINGGVKTVAQAIDALAVAVRAALNAGLNPGAANLSALTGGVTGAWTNTAVGDVYASSGGAAATGGKIYTINGKTYTYQQAIDYFGALTNAGRNVDAYYAFKSAGISLADADKLMNWPAMQAENWATANGYAVFANGGAFTNGIVTSPTFFDIGQMGEVDPEAIMPLANIGGRLGVHTTGGMDTGALLERIDALVATVEDLKEQQAEAASFMAAVIADSAKTNASSVTRGIAKSNKRDEFESRAKSGSRIVVKIA